MEAPSRPADPEDGVRPLIIVSAGRSGSTLLHELLALHEKTAWLSRTSDRHPRQPVRQRRVLAAAAVPVIGRLVRRRWRPDECYEFWDHHFPGFARPVRDLRGDDVTTPARAGLRGYFAGLTTVARPTALLKVTGWPRAGFLADVLDGARFVHIVRDGREVARSLLTMPWWLGWQGPDAWRFGPLTESEDAEWASSGKSFAHLAGIQWRKLLRAAELGADEVGRDAWMDVRFEDLCRSPDETLAKILEFGGLGSSPTISKAVRGGAIRPPKERWRTHLSTADQDALQTALGEPLESWGYA